MSDRNKREQRVRDFLKSQCGDADDVAEVQFETAGDHDSFAIVMDDGSVYEVEVRELKKPKVPR